MLIGHPVTGMSDELPSLEELTVAVYPELKRIARAYMNRESRKDHTLRPTALVNEIFVRFRKGAAIPWESPETFLHSAAKEMRRALIDHARKRRAAQRQAPDNEPPFALASLPTEDLLDLDRALDELEEQHPTSARVVELRYFAGLNNDEVAEVLGISRRTVNREWEWARRFLYGRLRGAQSRPVAPL